MATDRVPKEPVICIVGPTASGKSELAQLVCEHIDGEVVGADSMQVYRGMDIGTGKVPVCERRVAHHCIDIVDPGEPFSAALYQECARAAFARIEDAGKRSVLCGGTGFYVRAAIDDYRFPAGEQVDNPVREKWHAFEREYGPHALWEELAAVDAQSAAEIPENDVKRVIRAFELLSEGATYAEQKKKLATIPAWTSVAMFGLDVDPGVLRDRIDCRVDGMIEGGLVKEVSDLLEGGFRDALTAKEAIGYKEIVGYLDGDCTLEEAADLIKTATHRYAKRQRTWFRRDKRITWLEATEYDVEQLAASVLQKLEQ